MERPTPRGPRRPSGRSLLIGAAVAAVILLICVLGIVAGRLATGGGDGEQRTPAASTPPASEPEPEPVSVAMPDLVGKNAAIAEDELERLGFTDIQLGSADPADTFVLLAANWTVVEQSHEPGDKVPTDALIVLTCSKKA
ncbi:MAG TPA: PASTA domain-containing protein [Phytomonospora sp.]